MQGTEIIAKLQSQGYKIPAPDMTKVAELMATIPDDATPAQRQQIAQKIYKATERSTFAWNKATLDGNLATQAAFADALVAAN